MGQLFESVIMATKAILQNKTRAFLTMLGIIIGILSVSLMGTAISGIDEVFENSIQGMGQDVLYVQKYPWFMMNDEWWEYRNRPDIEEEYAEQILERASSIAFATPSTGRRSDVKYGKNAVEGVEINGTTWQEAYISALKLESGRFFSEPESRYGTRVAVIGYDIKTSLFPNEDPLGKEIIIQGIKFRIIGVIAQQGKFLGLMSMDNIVTIPLKSLQNIFGGRWGMSVSVKPKEGVTVEQAKEELMFIMRGLRGLKPQEENDFSINQQEAFRQQFASIRMAISAVGLGITALSLIVGGIGIMNIMFVSVRERTKEIGIRKALGAKKNIILFQFLSEAVIISLIGGTIGILITVGLVGLLQKFFVARLSIDLIIISLSVSVITGVLSGIVPANLAARLNPIEAIRYE
jgi:putative ABC transport system permease protein